MNRILSTLMALLAVLLLNAQEITVDRLTERIVVIDEGYFRSVAILTEKGVVLIDTRQPLAKMTEIKALIKQEFGVDTICYIINSHGCPEHIGGNSAFPEATVLMNDGFFKRKELYEEQKAAVDSFEVQCNNEHLSDSSREAFCTKFKGGEGWRRACIYALEENPDITFSRELTLHFEELSIQVVLIGLGHGYSNFIYIPQERFLHTSTINEQRRPLLFWVPIKADVEEFLPYQINKLQYFLSVCDSVDYIVPGHRDYYQSNELKQMLSYYINLYTLAEAYYTTNSVYEDFEACLAIGNNFKNFGWLKDLTTEELKRHNDNVLWLWTYLENKNDED